jgi:hypothetical protein
VESVCCIWSSSGFRKRCFPERVLKWYAKKVKGPTIFGGDFNLIIKSCEKSTGGVLGRWNVVFNIITEHNNLMELHLGNMKFTWSNDHMVPTFENFDWFLAITE